MKRLGDWVVKSQCQRVADHIPSGARVLDVGCGSGALISLLPPDVNYVGVDFNPELISQNRLKYPRVQFLSFDVSGSIFPFEAGCFDVVVLANIIETIENPRVMLTEVHRVLGAQGMVMIMTPSRWGKAILGGLSGLKMVLSARNQTDTHFVGKKEMKKYLESTHLEIKSHQTFLTGLYQFIVMKRGHLYG
jgi:2-polyprenyl-3-methyl-5-hydroxy-6-metoxy-1,4-benzoquinol methylase